MLTLPHLLIVAGVQGIVIAALLHGVLRGPAARNERRIPALGLRMSPGGIVVLVCGGIALLGFPLDAAWHALFGEDVTLWGPTHLFMIGGAGASTLGLWMVMRQGFELGRAIDPRALGSVPGARPVLRDPRPARPLRRRGRRLHDAALPLYLAEAAALGAPRAPLRFALLSGLGIGTLGLAAEWGWSHVWMAHPWPASLLSQALILALAAGVAGSVLGARIGQSLAMPAATAPACPRSRGDRWPSRAVALVALLLPLPRTGGDGTRAAIVPTPAGHGQVDLAVRLDPSDAARDNQWFEVISWQGRTPGRTRQLTQLREVGPGRYVAERPVPVGATGRRWCASPRARTSRRCRSTCRRRRRAGAAACPSPRARGRWSPTPSCCSARPGAAPPG